MSKFKLALECTLREMLAVDDNLCCAVYNDDICEDNAIVMFMEYGGYGTVHAVMKDLHARLSAKMGHPVSICHNDPTDENVLIHGHADDAQVYYSDECCKRNTLECYHRWVSEGRREESYRPEYRAIFKAVDCLSEGLDKTPDYILQSLNWDAHVLAQLTQLLINYHC